MSLAKETKPLNSRPLARLNFHGPSSPIHPPPPSPFLHKFYASVFFVNGPSVMTSNQRLGRITFDDFQKTRFLLKDRRHWCHAPPTPIPPLYARVSLFRVRSRARDFCAVPGVVFCARDARERPKARAKQRRRRLRWEGGRKFRKIIAAFPFSRRWKLVTFPPPPATTLLFELFFAYQNGTF